MQSSSAGVHLAAHEQQPRLMVAGDREREQVAARLGDLGRAAEAGERVVGRAEQPRQAAARDLGDRLGPRVAERVESLHGLGQLAAGGLHIGHRQRAGAPSRARRAPSPTHPRRRSRRTAGRTPPRPATTPSDGSLPHLAPQREEPGDGARVLRDRQLLAEQLQHPHAHLGEEAGDPPVDEQAPREVAGVVEAVGVHEVADRGAQVRQLEAELRDGVRLTRAAQIRGDARDEVAVVVRVRGAHDVGVAARLRAARSRTRARSRAARTPTRPSISVCLTSEPSTRAARLSSAVPVPRPADADAPRPPRG